jgi:hypothetical protein
MIEKTCFKLWIQEEPYTVEQKYCKIIIVIGSLKAEYVPPT